MAAHAGIDSALSGGSRLTATGLSVPGEEYWDSLIGKLKIADPVVAASSSIPTSVDLSQEPYFPRVGDQGMQGSCAAWAITYYAYGYLEAKNRGWTDANSGNPEHLMSPAWTYNKVNNYSGGGSWTWDNANAIAVFGCPTLSVMPYNDKDKFSWGSPGAWREAPLHMAKDWFTLEFNTTTTVTMIKSLLAQSIPVTFCIDARGLDRDDYFADGNYIISASDYDGVGMDHAQCIVGYNNTVGDDGDLGAFKVVNSWGMDSGDHGYYWITYDAFNKIGNDTFVTYLTDKEDYAPSLIATIQSEGFSHRCSLRVGIGDQEDNNSISFNFTGKGGPASSGQASPPIAAQQAPTFMCLDVSRFSDLYQEGEHTFFLNITNFDDKDTSIASFKLESYNGGYTVGHPTGISGDMQQEIEIIPAGGWALVTNSFDTYPPNDLNKALDYPNSTFSSGGGCAWTAEDLMTLTNGYGARSGTVDNGQSSWANVTVIGPGLLSFCWCVSSEPWTSIEHPGDHLCIDVDGSCMQEINGSQGWTLVELALGVGTHVIEWIYEKDGNGTEGSDAGWVDAVAYVPSTTLEDQNFESPCILTWVAGDLNPDSGSDYWGISDFRPVPLQGGGDKCFWCAQVGTNSRNNLSNAENHYYDSGMDAYYSATISGLSAFHQTWLEFDYYSFTYTLADHLQVEINDSRSWSAIWNQPEVGNQEWHHVQVQLASGCVAVRFHFHSLDYSPLSVFCDGAYVDNVRIEGYTLTPNASFGQPSVPRDLLAMAGIENITLSWNEPLYSNASMITGYRISYGTSPGSLPNQIILNQTERVISGLTKGQTYYFNIAAQNIVGWGSNSTMVLGMPLGTPDAPGYLYTRIGIGYINLTWSPPFNDGGTPILNYTIMRNPAPSPAIPWIINASTGVIWYNDTNVEAGTSYNYYVVASNHIGESNVSTVAATAAVAPKTTSNDWMLFVCIGAIAIIALAGAAFAVLRKRK